MNFKHRLVFAILQENQSGLTPTKIARISGLSYREVVSVLDYLEANTIEINSSHNMYTYTKKETTRELVAGWFVMTVLMGFIIHLSLVAL